MTVGYHAPRFFRENDQWLSLILSKITSLEWSWAHMCLICLRGSFYSSELTRKTLLFPAFFLLHQNSTHKRDKAFQNYTRVLDSEKLTLMSYFPLRACKVTGIQLC